MRERCHTADTCIYGRSVWVGLGAAIRFPLPLRVESNKNSSKIKMIIIFIGVFRILSQCHRLPEAHKMEIGRTQNVDEFAFGIRILCIAGLTLRRNPKIEEKAKNT